MNTLPAAIWFVRRHSRAQRRQAIVVVDLTHSGGSVARTQRRIRDVDRCTRGDSIHVLGRRMADIGNDLRIVTCESTPRSGYQLAAHRSQIDDRAALSRAADLLYGRKGGAARSGASRTPALSGTEG